MKKLVLISGSGRGLGSSMAKAFVENGYTVLLITSSLKKRLKNCAMNLVIKLMHFLQM